MSRGASRSKIDLADYPRDQTHHIELVLEDSAGTIRLQLTVSGTRVTAVDSRSQRVTTLRERTEIVRKYVSFIVQTVKALVTSAKAKARLLVNHKGLLAN